MELSMEGGMRAYIQRIIAAKSQLELVKLFKDVVLKSYGKKSADGRLFMKNDAIRAEFEAHPVYSMIYMDLVTDEAKASAFVNGIMPADMPNQNPATPKATGKTAASWSYEIKMDKSGATLCWKNSNIVNGVPIAVILQYGHGTRNGAYVQGVDYINPALAPIFSALTDELWKEVKRL